MFLETLRDEYSNLWPSVFVIYCFHINVYVLVFAPARISPLNDAKNSLLATRPVCVPYQIQFTGACWNSDCFVYWRKAGGHLRARAALLGRSPEKQLTEASHLTGEEQAHSQVCIWASDFKKEVSLYCPLYA